MRAYRKIIACIVVGLMLVACQGKSALEKSRTPLNKIKLATSIKIGTGWHKQIGKGAEKKPGSITPHVFGSTVYANSFDGTLKAISIRTGHTVWQTNPGVSFSSGIGGGTANIYAASSKGQILGFSRQNGKLVFKSNDLGGVNVAPAGNLGTVVAKTVDGKIYGLNTAGDVIWQQEHETPSLTIHNGAVPVFFDNKVILGLDDGNVMSLERNSGTLDWLEPVAYSHGRNVIDRIVDVDATPVIEANHMYVVSFHGNISKINIADGTPAWSARYSSVEPPAISGNTLLATHEDGLITAFAKDTGVKLWERIFLRGYSLTAPATYGRYVAVGVKHENAIFWLDSLNGKALAKSKVAGKELMSLVSSAYGILAFTKSGSLSLQRPL